MVAEIFNNQSSSVNLTNSTVTQNTAGDGLAGGGIFNAESIYDDGAVVHLQNSIVAGNTLEGTGDGPDIFNQPAAADFSTGAVTTQASLIGVADDMGDVTTFVDEGGSLLGTATLAA